MQLNDHGGCATGAPAHMRAPSHPTRRFRKWIDSHRDLPLKINQW
jgi:hypothetical protein